MCVYALDCLQCSITACYISAQGLDLKLFQWYQRVAMVSFNMCVHIHACMCLFLFLIYTHVHKQAHTSSAVRCSGKSVPSGWLVCTKSNVSPKYALANGRCLTITRPAPVGHGYVFLRSMFGFIHCFLVKVIF